MTRKTDDAPVTVEQCDRDDYADFGLLIGRLTARDAAAVRDGEWDATKDVRFFAERRHRLAALASAPAEPRLNPTPIETLADTFTGKTEVDRLAITLMRAFGKAEPKEGISQHPASYVATFAEMARAVIASAPAGDGELPDRLPGHWDGGDGAAIARACMRFGRSTLCKGDLSDMALANAVYLAERDDLDLIVWQTAAKERIRWLSAHLATALARPRAAVGEQSREVGLRHAVSEAKRNLSLTQGCLECNADDERRWAETIEWLERLS